MFKFAPARLAAVLTATCLLGAVQAGEMLYNGIVLPDTWPPRPVAFSREPSAPPPYLTTPPAVIPSMLSGKPMRVRFHLRKGRLYSFWVSPNASGASHGYVAAGGPGFTGNKDTVGEAAYRSTGGVK